MDLPTGSSVLNRLVTLGLGVLKYKADFKVSTLE
jgi:hypothetical protein